MKKETINNVWEWLFSDGEYIEGEKYDIHFILNTCTGEVKKIIQKRIELVSDDKEILVEEDMI